jgi:hypothetical protein
LPPSTPWAYWVAKFIETMKEERYAFLARKLCQLKTS